MHRSVNPTSTMSGRAATPSRGLRLLGLAATTLRNRERPGTDPAAAELRTPSTGMTWHQVGSSHVAGTIDGCYEVRCVRDLRWEAVFVPAAGSPPELVEGQGTIFRSFDEALFAVEAFDSHRRRSWRPLRHPAGSPVAGSRTR